METLPYTVIKSQNQYREYCERFVDLITIKRKTRTQSDTIELLSLLINQWDREQVPLSNTDPVEFLRSLMKLNKIKASDLAAGLGISKTLLSDVLHYRRRMSREVIRKLAFRFKVPQELLNKPYHVVSASADKRAKLPRNPGASRPQQAAKPTGNYELLLRLLNERIGLPTLACLRDGKQITIWNFMSGRRLGDPCPYLITNVKPGIADTESDCLFASSVQELIDRDSGEAIFRAES